MTITHNLLVVDFVNIPNHTSLSAKYVQYGLFLPNKDSQEGNPPRNLYIHYMGLGARYKFLHHHDLFMSPLSLLI